VLLVGSSGAVAALGDTLFPAQSLEHALAQDLSPTAHVLIRLRLLHPTLAALAALGMLALCAWAGPRAPGRLATLLACLTLGQTLLGGLNVVLLAPIPLQLAHLLLADFIWIALVLLAAEALREPAAAAVSAAA
jgi:heme A synthase